MAQADTVTIEEARAYVATTPMSGIGQLVLLMEEGLQPQHKVLEYGCGTLHLASALVPYLDENNYRGIDPNRWLREVARSDDQHLHQLLVRRGAIFGDVDDFDADMFGAHSFDYVFAHSVLSHAAAWQLPQFLDGALAALRPGGKIIASIRLGEDSNATEWQYPGVSYFSPLTIKRYASERNLAVRFAHEMQHMYMAIVPDEIHDWLVLEEA